MIHGPQKAKSLTVDLHEHLVQMPPPPAGFHSGNPPLLYLGRKHRTGSMPPVSHSLMTDIDVALLQQILDIAKGQRETDVHHNRQSDNLTARFEIAEWIRLGHLQTLQIRSARLKPVSSDSADLPHFEAKVDKAGTSSLPSV